MVLHSNHSSDYTKPICGLDVGGTDEVTNIQSYRKEVKYDTKSIAAR